MRGQEAAAGSDRYLFEVLEVVAHVGQRSRDGLNGRLDADLVVDLGLDSLQVLEIWIALETRLGLPEGMLGASQAITMRTMAESILGLACRPVGTR